MFGYRLNELQKGESLLRLGLSPGGSLCPPLDDSNSSGSFAFPRETSSFPPNPLALRVPLRLSLPGVKALSQVCGNLGSLLTLNSEEEKAAGGAPGDSAGAASESCFGSGHGWGHDRGVPRGRPALGSALSLASVWNSLPLPPPLLL